MYLFMVPEIFNFNSGYVFACDQLAAAIINYQYKVEKDQSRVLDMNAHLIRRAYQRAYLMKQFEREDLDDIKNLFKNF